MLYVIAASLLGLVVLVVATSLLYPIIGISAPLARVPLAATVTAAIVILATLVYVYDESVIVSHPRITRYIKWYVSLLTLPVITYCGTITLNRAGTANMLLVALALIGITILAYRFYPDSLHPFTIYVVTVSLLIPAEFASSYVIGHDIQLIYYVASWIMDSGIWSPAMGGSQISIPIMVAVPAGVASLLSAELVTVYKILYLCLFALTPVGLYYFLEGIFPIEVAFFAPLLYISNYLVLIQTPEKQILSQFFIVLVLLSLYTTEPRHSIIVPFLFGLAAIFTHYATILVFILVMLVAAILLSSMSILGYVNEQRLTLPLPLALLAVALAWYSAGFEILLDSLYTIPGIFFDQLASFVLFEHEHFGADAGAGMAETVTTVDQQLKLYTNVLIIFAICYGILEECINILQNCGSPVNIARQELIAMAIPLLGLLGITLIATFHMEYDRVYQITLLVTAPFAVVGYLHFRERVEGLSAISIPKTAVIGAFIVGILLLNIGLVGYVSGSSFTHTFDRGDPEYTYTESERAGAEWIADTVTMEKSTDPLETAELRDSEAADEWPRIHTDRYSGAILRAFMPMEYYRVNVIGVVDEYIGLSDYVFITDRGVVEADSHHANTGDVFNTTERYEVASQSSVIYDNGETTIVKQIEE